MTAEDVATQQGGLAQATLQHLFNSVDDPIDNPNETCARVIPYVRQALVQTPASRQLQETLAFLQCGVTQATHAPTVAQSATGGVAETEAEAQAPWTCSNGELHAIIHMLNDEQLLIEDRGTTTTANTATTTATTVHDAVDGLEGALAATVLVPALVALAAATAARLTDATSTASTVDSAADTECERDTAFLDELRTGAASCEEEEEEAHETYPGQHEEADNAFLRELAGSVEEWE